MSPLAALLATVLTLMPPPLYPTVGESTTILDHRALLGAVAEPEWYEANIPFVDLPDKDIQDTYYYRWRTFKEALKYTGPDDGWIVSEFLGPVGYSAPNGGINAAAGHHLYEGRWLRDTRYLDDYLDYWLRGSGSQAKPNTEGLGRNSYDWAHQYSFWAVDAALARAEVSGDFRYLVDRLPELEKQFKTWQDTNFDAAKGLYWQTPVWDAMEFTASSYQSPDPYHGGDGYRPTLNAYQYGDAKALATILRRAGQPSKAAHYDRLSQKLREAQERELWDGDFYKHVMKDTGATIADREQMGFVPWYFHMAPAGNAAAWQQLTDPQGFAARFGPTTTERRSPWFMHEALNGCCRWDGPSWPYATSQTLTAMANQLIDYPAQPYVDGQDYYDVLRGYALTQRKNGRPYVAEAHHPDEDRWIYDGANHSEDYNHSTFTDLVLSGLLGIRPQAGASVQIAPLAPASWDHWAVENVAYHGRNLSVVWDASDFYGRGRGLSVWLDGVLVHRQPTLAKVTVPVASDRREKLPSLVDDAANVDETGYPVARASYSWGGDPAVNAIDGQNFHLDVPSTRWTTWSSPNRSDWLEVDLGAATVVSDVRIDFYDDGGGVRTPSSYALQYQAADGTWQDVPGQIRSPAAPIGRAINRVMINPPLTTDRLRVLPVRDDGGAVGITAFQAWRQPDPALAVSFVGLEEGAIEAGAGQTVTVRSRVTATKAAGDVRVALEVPRGWSARAVTAATASRLSKGDSFGTTWRVTIPEGAALADGPPIRALATSRAAAGVSSAVAAVKWYFDPADFPVTAWQDDFSTDRLSSYRVDRLIDNEPAPALSVADGALTARASGRVFGVLAMPVTGSPRGTAVIVTPRAFGGGDPEDSLFAGASKSPSDNALIWYNNHWGTSGADVRVAGVSRPEATGGCCADYRWQAGDRIAAVTMEGHLTTWLGRDGTWRQIHDAPVSAAVDNATVATWNPAFGLRLDAGAIALDEVTVRTR